ncbi:hypothetical protein ALP18_200384 [Pseudomonas amygdali pv. myricae]|nr:hypothetical protein ALP18_200384 [Pseudomonas amygdali pv. myricae]
MYIYISLREQAYRSRNTRGFGDLVTRKGCFFVTKFLASFQALFSCVH